jgi:GGDEF domain-containing protein
MNKANALQLVDTLARDQTYGCYSRQGLELVIWPKIAAKAKHIIFADIDDMHALNDTHGYAAVDRKIRQALKVRSSDVAAIGRWYSGDEIVWIISDGDPEGMVKRLSAGLEKQGLSATFAIAPVTSRNLSVNVTKAAEQVQAMKKGKKRD